MAANKGGNTADKARSIAEPVAKEMGLKLWDIRFLKEGVSWFLRIFIDSDDGITIEDCEKFSRAIDPVIDEKNFINDFYYLEVCSPGIGRELTRDEHLEFAVDKEVFIKFIRPEKELKEIIGILKTFDNEKIVIESENKSSEVLRNNIAKIKLNDDEF